jgi:hypothetical protein
MPTANSGCFKAAPLSAAAPTFATLRRAAKEHSKKDASRAPFALLLRPKNLNPYKPSYVQNR